MDIMTMAMCKPKVINLNDYGIDLASLVLGGNGTTNVDAVGLWEKINSGRDVVFLCDFNGAVFKLIPTVFGGANNIIANVGMKLQAHTSSVMFDASISLATSISGSGFGSTTVACATTSTPLS